MQDKLALPPTDIVSTYSARAAKAVVVLGFIALIAMWVALGVHHHG